ncbi:hypothetical protein NKH73_13965 [Mesorhizobium sp. M0938]|uniref:Lar family restriction alleviation protein n=1 Tax=unclassified Mesorhizobium TaxID=325217 RepID=UPI00333BE75D
MTHAHEEDENMLGATTKPTEGMLDALKPCPFCGCHDVSPNDNGHEEWFECDWCHATSGFDEDPAFEAEPRSFHWNRRATLTKSSPVEAVAVKGLEWRVFCSKSGNCEAETSFGLYIIQNEEGLWVLYLLDDDAGLGGKHKTIEAAQATAQADYEARIRSCLAPPLSNPEAPAVPVDETLQARVQPWLMSCFGREISMDRVERGDRLLEEVFELLQSCGYDPARVLALRDYVWGRDAGEPSQEAGGVMITLAGYCLAHDLNMHEAGEAELARIWTKVDKIRAKQAAKPVGSALPVAALVATPPAPTSAVDGEVVKAIEPFALLVEQQDASDLAFLKKNGGDESDMSHYSPDGAKVHSSGEMRHALYLTKGDFRKLAKVYRALSNAQAVPAATDGAVDLAVRRKFELWFFRDIFDEHRLALFSIFGMPADEIGKTHGIQRIALKRVLRALAGNPSLPSGGETGR